MHEKVYLNRRGVMNGVFGHNLEGLQRTFASPLELQQLLITDSNKHVGYPKRASGVYWFKIQRIF